MCARPLNLFLIGKVLIDTSKLHLFVGDPVLKASGQASSSS